MVQSFKGNYFRLPLVWSQGLTIISELRVCFIQKQFSFWAPSVLCHVNWSVIKREFWYSKHALLVLKCCCSCTHTKATWNCLNLQSKFWQGSEQAQAAWSASLSILSGHNTQCTLRMDRIHDSLMFLPIGSKITKYLLGLNKINCIV